MSNSNRKINTFKKYVIIEIRQYIIKTVWAWILFLYKDISLNGLFVFLQGAFHHRYKIPKSADGK